jgi:acetyl esterase
MPEAELLRRAPMDPQASAVVAERAAAPPDGLAAQRARYDRAAFALPPEPLGAVEDLTVPRPGGGRVPVRAYWPRDAGPGAGCLVWMHGGGWMVGSVAGADHVARALAARSGAIVVSVDYRLAPEDPHPAALEDVEAVLLWVTSGSGVRRLGHDPARVVIGGDSAGGHLATIAARRARDGVGRVRPVAQVLAYPVTDAAIHRPAYAVDAATITRAGIEACWSAYAGDRLAAAAEDPNLSPMAADPHGLPPTLLLVAGHDVLRDDGVAYAERLRAAGVPVELVLHEDEPHGFLDWSGRIDRGAEALSGLAVFVRRHAATG